MKYLVIGRSGVGKDTLREALENQLGWNFVKSYTTRKKRFESENTHVFITAYHASQIHDKVAKTFIDNGEGACEYFATSDQVKNSDAYIVDPFGAYQVLCNMPDEKFRIIYVYPVSKMEQIKAIKNRGDNIFDMFSRLKDESAMFYSFERLLWIMSMTGMYFNNLDDILFLCNGYKDISIESMVARVSWMQADAYPLVSKQLDNEMFEKYYLK